MNQTPNYVECDDIAVGDHITALGINLEVTKKTETSEGTHLEVSQLKDADYDPSVRPTSLTDGQGIRIVKLN